MGIRLIGADKLLRRSLESLCVDGGEDKILEFVLFETSQILFTRRGKEKKSSRGARNFRERISWRVCALMGLRRGMLVWHNVNYAWAALGKRKPPTL